jgi:3-methyl-2-oxobutanoate hydroxymethyltransferase
MRQVTINTLHRMKEQGKKIAMLTAYDFYTARSFDAAGVDIILVGDTLGMAFGGHDTTLGVRIEQMVYHCEIVSRAVDRCMVVGDLPFLSYQVTTEAAVENAGRLMQDGNVQAVKLEGGRTMVPVIKRILRAGIPVMGHIGLTPQSVHRFGGWRVQGKDAESAERVYEAAQALQHAGCFSIVLEAIPGELATRIAESLEIPVIGIGAGPNCDGQVLVSADMLGVTDFSAKYLKRYAAVGEVVREAAARYCEDVKQGKFPSDAHGY